MNSPPWRGGVVTALALLGMALGASAAQRWIRVEGGSWAPAADVIGGLQAKIWPFVSARARAEGRALREPDSYTFQYQGQEARGRRFVFVNAFCAHHEGRPLDQQMVVVSDGGTCFFSLKYDAETGLWFDLVIHHDA